MIEIIKDRQNWNKLIKTCSSADFYHTYDYHMIDKKDDERAVLIHYRDDKVAVLLPLIIRRIDGTEYYDATSVYGYPGPLVAAYRHDANLKAFQEELNAYFLKENLVSVFSRLNPFIPHQEVLLKGMGKILSPGAIINIDLTRDDEHQLKGYHRRLKTYINSLRKKYTIDQTPPEERVDRFIDLYYENMRRVGAKSRYFFDRDYFYNIMASSSFKTALLSAEDMNTGEMVAGSLFTLKNNIVQYHLSGVSKDHLKLNPVKLLIDEMRTRATSEGYRFFNLGGGLANRKDSLFEFKLGFSDDVRAFKVWRYVVQREVYSQLAQEKHGGCCVYLAGGCPDFFPCYRCESPKIEF